MEDNASVNTEPRPIRLQGIKEIFKLRMENEKGQRIGAFIFVHEKEGWDKTVSLVIMDGSESNAERAFYFPGSLSLPNAVCNAKDVKRFLKEFRMGALRQDEEGNRVKIPPGKLDVCELSRA